MSQPPIAYEAAIYRRLVHYTNFNGDKKVVELTFALDPMQLMQTIASFEPKKIKSGNPARQASAEWSDEDQVKFVRTLASKAAGTASPDGEVWEPFEDFADHIAGKAFLVKLASSDGDRKEFAEKVILAPFRAFVGFADVDPTNTPKDKQELKQMLTQLENIFLDKPEQNETIDERRARLKADLDALEGPGTTEALLPNS